MGCGSPRLTSLILVRTRLSSGVWGAHYQERHKGQCCQLEVPALSDNQ
jgi:hypothetical protein